MRREHPQQIVRQYCVAERHVHVPRGFWAYDEGTDGVSSIGAEVQGGCSAKRIFFTVGAKTLPLRGSVAHVQDLRDPRREHHHYCWDQTIPLSGSVAPAKSSARLQLRLHCSEGGPIPRPPRRSAERGW